MLRLKFEFETVRPSSVPLWISQVGYMAGPLGTIVSIVETGQLQKAVNPTTWTVGVAATGLVLGECFG